MDTRSRKKKTDLNEGLQEEIDLNIFFGLLKFKATNLSITTMVFVAISLVLITVLVSIAIYFLAKSGPLLLIIGAMTKVRKIAGFCRGDRISRL